MPTFTSAVVEGPMKTDAPENRNLPKPRSAKRSESASSVRRRLDGTRAARGLILPVAWSLAVAGILASTSCHRAEDTSRGASARRDGESRRSDASSADARQAPPAAQKPGVKALEAEAVEVIERLMRRFPNRPELLVLMGSVHARFGDADKATKCWEKSLETAPRRADAHASIARVAQGAGRYEQSAERWKKALEIDPAIRGGRVGLARALMGLGKGEQAVSVLLEEIARAPREALPQYILGKAYLELGQFDKAVNCYRTAVELNPEFTRAYYGLSMACARLARDDEAREHMEKFRELKSRDRKKFVDGKRRYDDTAAVGQLVALAYTQAGLFYQSNGCLIEAEQHWLKAAELDPKNPICRTMLASAYKRTLRYAEALRMYRQLVKMSPGNADYHVGLGIMHAQLNQLDAALEALRRAVELDPENRKYRKIHQEIRRKKGLESGEDTNK